MNSNNPHKNPFKVPENYFEDFPEKISNKISSPKSKPHFIIQSQLALVGFMIAIMMTFYFGIEFALDNYDNINNNQTVESNINIDDNVEITKYDEDLLIDVLIEDTAQINQNKTIEDEDIIEYLIEENIDYDYLLAEL